MFYNIFSKAYRHKFEETASIDNTSAKRQVEKDKMRNQ